MRLAPVAVAAVACLLTACGAERTTLPDPNSALRPSGPTRPLEFPRAGMSLRVPRLVKVMRRPSPAVFRFSLPSGAAVSAFAYRREEPVPRDPSALRQARRRLVAAAGERDPKFELTSSRLFRAGGAPGVEVVGTQNLAGNRLQTRSIHLFKADTEYVLELIARPADFGIGDRLVFSPMLRSLELTGARAP